MQHVHHQADGSPYGVVPPVLTDGGPWTVPSLRLCSHLHRRSGARGYQQVAVAEVKNTLYRLHYPAPTCILLNKKKTTSSFRS